MSERTNQIEEMRKRIKQELQELEETNKGLHARKEKLKAYITYLEELYVEVGKATSETQLIDIIRRGELQTQIIQAFFKMSKYLIEKEIEQKIEDAKEMLKECLQEIKNINWRRKTANVCPHCQGRGWLREVEFIREDGLVNPVLRVITCPLCEGKRIIDLIG
jgi:phage-related protein